MKLEYRYGQAYLVEEKPEDIISISSGDFITLKNPMYNTLIINCEHLYLYQTSIDLKIEVPKEKLEQIDYLIINGIKFKKDRSK